MPSENADGTVIHLPQRAGALIFVEEGLLLLSRKKSRRELQFPKGIIEPGETRDAARDRESLEEAGVHGLQSYGYLGTYRISQMQKESLMRMKTVHMDVCTPVALQNAYLPTDENVFQKPVKVPFDLAYLESRMYHPEEFEFLRQHETALQWYAESFHGYYCECLAEAVDS